MESWEMLIALLLLSPLILTVSSFLIISIVETIREAGRGGEAEELSDYLEELLRRRR